MSSAPPKEKKRPSRSYSQTTIKILYGQSGNECAEPNCSNPIIADASEFAKAANVAHIAHIYAFSEDGPRGKKGMTPAQLNHHSNLLLLCPTHHAIVDTQHENYPAELLLKWKEQHIRKYSDTLKAKISDVGYNELEVAARALMVGEDVTDDAGGPIAAMPPAKKIERNLLGPGTARLLKMGIAMSHEVKAMLRNAAQLDSGFPDRLRDGFQQKYVELAASGLSGDDLFDSLYVWSGGANREPKRALAGLCLLSHLFVLCDVFESE